jgi:hypothetical protein
LFASNVRSYLNVKKRSKEIADVIQKIIEQRPDQFLICNNGVTIQCSNATLNDSDIYLERASVSNGCQTVMNVDRYFREHSNANPNADVLVTVIELKKDAASISSEVAIARNNQNPVDNRDLKSNHPLDAAGLSAHKSLCTFQGVNASGMRTLAQVATVSTGLIYQPELCRSRAEKSLYSVHRSIEGRLQLIEDTGLRGRVDDGRGC